MLVGEQPGDHEDREGAPFVGPAGRLLDGALAEAGVDRDALYVTNAVKHFKWEERGKRRLHKRPSAAEMHACHPWLAAEIDAVRPALILGMGAVAAQSLVGPKARVTRDRGQLIVCERQAPVMLTIHPSAILRARDAATRQKERAGFVADLVRAWEIVCIAPATSTHRSGRQCAEVGYG
jgi:DNA polymerase